MKIKGSRRIFLGRVGASIGRGAPLRRASLVVLRLFQELVDGGGLVFAGISGRGHVTGVGRRRVAVLGCWWARVTDVAKCRRQEL